MKGGKRVLQVQTRVEMNGETQEPPALVDPPVPGVEQEAPTQSELERGVKEAVMLGEVGMSPELSLTWKLAQMAVEARPSMSGGEEPARRKLWSTVRGKSPQKEFMTAGKVKKPQRYWLGTVALCEIHPFRKVHTFLYANSLFHI